MPAFKGWRQERIKTLDYRIPSGDTCYYDNSFPDHQPISLPCEFKACRSLAQSCSQHTNKTDQLAAEGGSKVFASKHRKETSETRSKPGGREKS